MNDEFCDYVRKALRVKTLEAGTRLDSLDSLDVMSICALAESVFKKELTWAGVRAAKTWGELEEMLTAVPS